MRSIKDRRRTNSNIECVTTNIIRLLFACTSVIMSLAGTFSLCTEQPLLNGFCVLLFGVILSSIAIGYDKIELLYKEIKLRLSK
jgi:hypothetical protein